MTICSYYLYVSCDLYYKMCKLSDFEFAFGIHPNKRSLELELIILELIIHTIYIPDIPLDEVHM